MVIDNLESQEQETWSLSLFYENWWAFNANLLCLSTTLNYTQEKHQIENMGKKSNYYYLTMCFVLHF